MERLVLPAVDMGVRHSVLTSCPQRAAKNSALGVGGWDGVGVGVGREAAERG